MQYTKFLLVTDVTLSKSAVRTQQAARIRRGIFRFDGESCWSCPPIGRIHILCLSSSRVDRESLGRTGSDSWHRLSRNDIYLRAACLSSNTSVSLFKTAQSISHICFRFCVFSPCYFAESRFATDWMEKYENLQVQTFWIACFEPLKRHFFPIGGIRLSHKGAVTAILTCLMRRRSFIGCSAEVHLDYCFRKVYCLINNCKPQTVSLIKIKSTIKHSPSQQITTR